MTAQQLAPAPQRTEEPNTEPRTDDGLCPACGETAINVQGLLDCPDCGFQG